MAFVIGNANKMLLLLLLFEIKALIDRIVGAWKLKLGKKITRHNVISCNCHSNLSI